MISVRHLLHPSKSREKVWQALGPFLRLARARPIIGCMPQHGNFLTGLGKLEGVRGPPSSPKAVTGKSPPDGGRQFLCTQVLLYGSSDRPSNQSKRGGLMDT